MRTPMRRAGSWAFPAAAASAPDDPLMTPGDAGRPPAPRLGAPGRARAFSTAGDVPESKEEGPGALRPGPSDRKSTRLNSSHGYISYAVFCLKKKKKKHRNTVH